MILTKLFPHLRRPNCLVAAFFALAACGMSLYSFLNPSYPIHARGTVLITGASTGIGRHAAVHLATTRPALTVLAGVRKPADAASVLQEGLSNLRPILLDVTDAASIASAAAALAQSAEPLIGLVSNAGLAAGPTTVEYHDLGEARRLFDVNFFGALAVTQALLPLLRASEGRLVAVSSVFGAVSPPMGGVYAASKFALEAAHDSLRRELAAANVSVSIVAPGAVATPIFRTLESASLASSVARQLPAVAVYPHLYTPKDIENEVKIEQMADAPSVTTAAIDHALFAQHPRTRYFCANILGAPAWLLALLAKVLPTRLMDIVMLQKG